jgi:hypothetical protein
MHEGCYEVIDSEDGERVARVARFMPGDLVLVEAARITSTALARAMVSLVDELDAPPADEPEGAQETPARPAHLRDDIDAAGRTATFSDPDHIVRDDGGDPRDPDAPQDATAATFIGDPRLTTPPEPWSP